MKIRKHEQGVNVSFASCKLVYLVCCSDLSTSYRFLLRQESLSLNFTEKQCNTIILKVLLESNAHTERLRLCTDQ